MAKSSAVKPPETTPPAFPETTPNLTDMPAYTTQMIFEMNGTLGRIEEKLANMDKRMDLVRKELREDLSGIDDRFRSIEKHWHWIAGGIAVAIILIPASLAVVWYSLGERINAALHITSGSSDPTK